MIWIMLSFGVLTLMLVVNWQLFRRLSRYLAARRRAAPPPSVAKTAVRAQTPATSPSTDPVEQVPEPSALAFPVQGLAPGYASARTLEALLQRLHGVTSAYVSPVTALAYIKYFPEQVTEEQLVAAMVGGGCSVDALAQRFDWRHSSGAEPLAAMSTTSPSPPKPSR
jgi:hypothetical protein